jgi:hypothetical protein
MAERPNDSALADAYLRQYETKDPDLFWAFEEVLEICASDRERAWQLTLTLIAKAPNPESLSYVAAGPLEDFLKNFGSAVIDRIETAARRDPKFRLALCDVWGLSGEIFERAKIAVGSGSNYQWGGSA